MARGVALDGIVGGRGRVTLVHSTVTELCRWSLSDGTVGFEWASSRSSATD